MKTLYFIVLATFIISSDSTANQNVSLNYRNKLIFIYNASNDYLSIAFDFTHKIISPKTYECSLCKVTYGAFKMHKEWKDYLESVDLEVIFLYKNNYKKYFPNLNPKSFPASYIYNGKSYMDFLDRHDFDSCDNLESLIKLIDIKLKKSGEEIQKY